MLVSSRFNHDLEQYAHRHSNLLVQLYLKYNFFLMYSTNSCQTLSSLSKLREHLQATIVKGNNFTTHLSTEEYTDRIHDITDIQTTLHRWIKQEFLCFACKKLNNDGFYNFVYFQSQARSLKNCKQVQFLRLKMFCNGLLEKINQFELQVDCVQKKVLP